MKDLNSLVDKGVVSCEDFDEFELFRTTFNFGKWSLLLKQSLKGPFLTFGFGLEQRV